MEWEDRNILVGTTHERCLERLVGELDVELDDFDIGGINASVGSILRAFRLARSIDLWIGLLVWDRGV